MKYLSSVITSLFICVVTPYALFGQSSPTIGGDLDIKLGEIAEKYNLKGLAASVAFSDGSVWSGAIGNHGTNGELSTDMLFEMGSNTKTFTSSIILQMASEGKLKLTDTLGQYFDSIEFVDMGVTIKQLLNHTSGIYSYTNHADFGTSISTDPNKIWLPQEVLEKFMKPMRFLPGTKWEYSNTNYLLLGLIIEKVDGRKYEESLRKRLFEPQNMEHSYLDIFESYTEPRSGAWLSSGAYLSDPFPSFMSSAWAAGGIVSTTEDLSTWAKKLYTNQVLTQAWTDSMKTQGVVNGKKTGYGLGMFYRKYSGHEIFGHGGTTLQHSTMEYVPDYDFALVTVINEQSRGGASGPVHDELLDYLFQKPWGLGIENSQQSPINIFPNPASQQVFVSGVSGEEIITIRSVNGGAGAVSATAQNGMIDISHLAQGVYILEIQSQDGELLKVDRLLIY